MSSAQVIKENVSNSIDALQCQSLPLSTSHSLDELTINPKDGHNHNSISVSLRVCTDCHKTLLHAFDHCLSHQGELPELKSIHEIDEIRDAIVQSEQPYFEVITDPTVGAKKPNPEEESLKVAKDRWVFAEQKRAKEKRVNLSRQLAQALPVKGGGSGPKAFSGALYKQMLDHKDREIQSLREQLYEYRLAEGFEAQNVDKLKRALNKAVKYYTCAEEWQKSESARLQRDVQFLKAELSSMMAFLINAEEEKQKVIRFWEEDTSTFAHFKLSK
jgi:hypothetical protein